MTADQEQLFEVLRVSLWGGKPTATISDTTRAELQAQTVDGLTAFAYPNGNQKYMLAAQFVQMANVQRKAIELLQAEDIPVVVLKGTASGIYYPVPFLRIYGDIDLMVPTKHYNEAISILKDNGWMQQGEVGQSNTALWKDNQLLELHHYPPGMDEVPEGAFMMPFMQAGFENIQTGIIDQPRCEFPMLPWKQNGLELIWHFRVHLYNGIGIRHAIDWMMFVYRNLQDADSFAEFKQVLEQSGLMTIAQTVTRMCVKYLGLPGSYVWCEAVDESLCDELMAFILDQGNFGHKRTDDKAAKVMTKYRTPWAFLRGMQQKGTRDWPAAQKYPILRPFAWIREGIQGLRLILSPGGRAKFATDLAESRQRKALMDQLYGKELQSPDIHAPHTPVQQPVLRQASKSRRQKLRTIYEKIKRTPLRVPLYYLQEGWFLLRYQLFRKPKISGEDRANVEKNITFFYKSFNRQRLAKRLYRSIKAYYPKARVVIADDSEEPLTIPDMTEGDTIIHLPFNSGLSKGLIAALEQVKTPFTMRLDDDLMLTPSTKVHDQYAFLQKHKEVDLVAVQMGNHHPQKSAARFSRIRMNKRLIIPAGTMIDGREVVYKTPNVFLARTDSLRKVGYDPNIRMIDHHEFFFRAAGRIVCVQDAHAYVMHCHNLFEKSSYNDYRGDYSGDAEYIAKKHGVSYH